MNFAFEWRSLWCIKQQTCPPTSYYVNSSPSSEGDLTQLNVMWLQNIKGKYTVERATYCPGSCSWKGRCSKMDCPKWPESPIHHLCWLNAFVHDVSFTSHPSVLRDRHDCCSHVTNETIQTVSYFPKNTWLLGYRAGSLEKQRGLYSEWIWKLGLLDPELSGIKAPPSTEGGTLPKCTFPHILRGPSLPGIRQHVSWYLFKNLHLSLDTWAPNVYPPQQYKTTPTLISQKQWANGGKAVPLLGSSPIVPPPALWPFLHQCRGQTCVPVIAPSRVPSP